MATNNGRSPVELTSRLYDENEEACFAFYPTGRDHVYPVADPCDWARYITLNPHVGRRLDQNVTVMRNLLIQVQDPGLSHIIATAFPWTTAVLGPSGVDFVASLAEPANNREEYQVLLSALASYCLMYGHFQMPRMNPSQLTLLPRTDQQIILIGNRVSREVFNKFDIYHQLPAGLKYATGSRK